MDQEHDEKRAETGTTVPARAKAPLSADTAEVPAAAGRTGATHGIGGFDADWDDGEEAAEQARRADRELAKRSRRLTGALALVAVLGVGFVFGVLYEKHGGHGSPARLHAAAASSHSRRAGGHRHAGAAGGGAVVGTVTSISGGTLYVTARPGSALVKVVTGPSSTVTVPSTASVASIQPGDVVVVQGAKQANGSYMAGTITDRGPSATAGAAGTV